MDSFELTKIVGGLCSTFLAFLLIHTGANAIIGVGPDAQHGDEEHHNAYVIEVEDASGEPADEEPAEELDIAALMEAADPANGESLYKACASCHKLDTDGVGPHLGGVVGREIGSVAGFSYSDALASHGGAWTPENLIGFLGAPSDWAPGTKMSYRGMRDAQDRADLVAYLENAG